MDTNGPGVANGFEGVAAHTSRFSMSAVLFKGHWIVYGNVNTIEFITLKYNTLKARSSEFISFEFTSLKFKRGVSSWTIQNPRFQIQLCSLIQTQKFKLQLLGIRYSFLMAQIQAITIQTEVPKHSSDLSNEVYCQPIRARSVMWSQKTVRMGNTITNHHPLFVWFV